MDDTAEAKAYYAELEGFGKEANIGTTIGCTYSRLTATRIIKRYLEFRGYKLPRTVDLEYVSMILMELDTRDERTRCGLSLMLWDDKVKNSPLLDNS